MKLLKDNNSRFNDHSKREMIEVLYPMLINKNQLDQRFQLLSNEAKKVILTFCLSDKLVLSKEELKGIVPKLEQQHFVALISELKQNGMIFTDAEKNFIIPIQIKKELVGCFQDSVEMHSVILPSRHVQKTDLLIVNDIVTFIDILTERALPLTKNGLLHKKDFQIIMKQLSSPENLPNDKWRFGYGRRFSQYPDRFSLIYDFCFDREWITEKDEQLQISNRVEELQNIKLKDFLNAIVNYWLKLYRRPIPSINLLYKLILTSLKEGEGVEEEYLISMLSTFVDEYYFDTKEDIISKRFLTMLIHLQVIEKVEFGDYRGYTLGPASRLTEKI
jgi:hypothetical protein